MRVNRYHILIMLMWICVSCIDPFNPQINESQEVMTINGYVTNVSGPHRVSISRSTPYNDPSFVPVTGCVVAVEDETGTVINYSEVSPGEYEAYLDTPFLQTGKSYSLLVITDDGSQYRSDYETMLACAPVGSIYYEEKTKGTADPDINLHGIQFYVDLVGSEETASSYRWLLEETWWYTAPHFGSHIWDGDSVWEYYSNYMCNTTNIVRGFYSSTTRNLSVNALNKQPLHFVSNETPRLMLKYSVRVMQQSLSDEAYDFWLRMGSQSGKGINLYETQPSSPVGNIYNVDDPSERVLGYFYASQITEKRLTLYNHFDFPVDGYHCTLDTINDPSVLGDDLPYYLISLDPTPAGGPPYLVGPKKCFDCTLYGGTTEEPDF